MCVELRMSPSDFWALKADEYAALVDELKTRHQQQAAKAQRRG